MVQQEMLLLARMLALVIALCAGRAESQTTFNDGGAHSVTTTLSGLVLVEAGTSSPTTVNFLSGAFVQGPNTSSGGTRGVAAQSGGIINLSGGTIAGGYGIADEALDSLINIDGGDIQGGIWIQTGGSSNKIDIVGSEFDYPYGSLSATSGTITGILSDGSTFDESFSQASAGQIVLSPVPELGTLALLATGGAWLLKYRFWRRRLARRAAPAVDERQCR